MPPSGVSFLLNIFDILLSFVTHLSVAATTSAVSCLVVGAKLFCSIFLPIFFCDTSSVFVERCAVCMLQP